METKQVKKIIIVILLLLAIFAISIIISITVLNNTTENYQNTLNQTSQNETNLGTFEEDIAKVKNVFNKSNVEITDLEEGEYLLTGKCESLDSAIEEMISLMEQYEKIDYHFFSKNYLNTYSKSLDRYSESKYRVGFYCDINHIKTESEMKSIIKDCSQIIWEGLKMIYGNANINNTENIYFPEIQFYFEFAYKYMNDYGFEKQDYHTLSFTISRESFNKINLENYDYILALDYSKIFELGEAYITEGKYGLNINYKNLLTK